ncbi:MAG: hypothetical protein ABSD59_15560 [Terracidiphilus sp.]|jgi:hypothetical protein
MPATPITDPATSESLVGIEPQLQQQVDPGWWRQRLNLYTGRTLTVDALDSEQFYRAGLLATLGQAVTAGTVSGFALTMDTSGPDPLLTISPGYGIMANGQDVVLNTTLKTHLSSLTVIDPVTGTDVLTFRQLVGNPLNSTYAGILLLQPVIAQVSGQQLDTGSLPTIVSGNLGASCAQDPQEYAFEDWQIADAVRLVYLPWPAGVQGGTNLELPPMQPEATWRNRLAYAIFNAEAYLGPDDQLPWAMLGLPVALIGFDPGIAWQADTAYTAGQFITDSNYNIQTVQTAGTSGATVPAATAWSKVWGGPTTDGSVTWVNSGLAWKPLFVDCNAVVRAGGLPRNRYMLPAQPPPVQLWQPATTFAQGAFIIDSNGNVQIASVKAQTGSVPPQWQLKYGQTTTDGSETWTNNGPAAWQANTNFNAGQYVFDELGNQQVVFTAGVTGTVEPDWNGIYLPTQDGAVVWINNGTGNPPVAQPAMAQARINQLSEQLSQIMTSGGLAQKTLADYFATLPPSGILPVAALDFSNQTAPWFPANWTISAAPVFYEELETVLETGMLMDPIQALTSAPEDSDYLEPVEVLVPLPDTLYDPNILVTDTVPQAFYDELDEATEARNLTLQKIQTVQEELNTIYAAIGPNVPSNSNLIDPDAGLTPDELASRDTPPPYTPLPSETFATVLQGTWEPSSSFDATIPAQFVIDSNGAIQVAQNSGTSAPSAPDWTTTIGETTSDGVAWISRGKTAWQANTQFTAGQLVLNAAGQIETALTGGTSGSAAPGWNSTTTIDNAVTWTSAGNTPWQQSTTYSVGQAIIDPNGNIQVVVTGGESGSSAPTWNKIPGQNTTDNQVTWINHGYSNWQANYVYSAGYVIVDATGTIQKLTTAGTSGTSAPSWNTTPGATTTDGLQWSSLGAPQWQALTRFTANQVILDPTGTVQQVQDGGTSGATAPTWNETPGVTTFDASITWLNNGPWAWQPNTAYVAGQFVVDPQGFRQTVAAAGTSASEQPVWLQPKPTGTVTSDGGMAWVAKGKSFWQPSTQYAAGAMILDANGNIQTAQEAGASGAKVPFWDPNFNQVIEDNTVKWQNLGHSTWTAAFAYAAGQALIDSTGSIQAVQQAGTSGATEPNWLNPEAAGQNTQDGILWQSGGSAGWQADYLYAAGQLIFANQSIQIVQTGGISGDNEPTWNLNQGQNTQDSGVVWTNLGQSVWQANTPYAAGQAIVDANGDIQLATIGGTSGAIPPKWSEGGTSTTLDVSVTWRNDGPMTWTANTNYAAGQIIIDSNGGLQYATVLDANGNAQSIGTRGVSGATEPVWNTTPGDATLDNAITWELMSYYSTDLLQVESTAAAAPYTFSYTDSNGNPHTISLLSQSDLTNLQTNGLQALITSLNARISQANDLLDTGFLTAQTDIYRLRNFVLGATAATTLATSPVLANIATGETAAATAENLQSYISGILPTSPTTTTSTTTSGQGGQTTTTSTTNTPLPVYNRPVLGGFKVPVVSLNNVIGTKLNLNLAATSFSVRSRAVASALGEVKASSIALSAAAPSISRNLIESRPVSEINKTVAFQAQSGVTAASSAFTDIVAGKGITIARSPITGPAQIVIPGQNAPATSTDITSQSPLAGAQVNVRTLTIAERLQLSPSQEGMFYAIANRLNFLQSLETLENDLNLVADDLPILVDDLPSASITTPSGIPPVTRYFSEYLGPSGSSLVSQIQAPYFVSDASEATLFSVGVRVIEQHSMLLRALEARVQQYSDFVNVCQNALQNMQNNIQSGTAYIAQLTNNLLQDRQNVAFTNALLQDEIQLVQSTNAQRQQVLSTAVQLIVYTRARTLEITDTVPSRQLVPANVTNPVPACLQQSVAIPPELREIVGQLREAPVSWLPSVNSQVSNLERPVLLQQLAIATQARASLMLQMPQLPSSAAGEGGAYAPTIANLFTSNLQVFRNYTVQRAAIQPAAISGLSWSQQVASLQSVAVVNDLISSDAVHTEVSNAVARLIQQISSVATCLYTRVSIEQPVDRLTWANFLTGPGLSVQLQSLAVLPGWNELAYTDRQQMQMLVDWLFLQIDASVSAAIAFMSDVVRTAILLASDVPVDNIIPGNIIARVQPAVGGTVTLNLPSDRIASGMYVNLYSGATLAARAVVSDLDTSTVKATVTDVFAPGTYLNTSDVAHFTTLAPQAVALRPLFMQS